MKLTEQMNIGGFAFHVECDAAALLDTYLGSVRERYAEDPSCDEICSDIEERIGELLEERCGGERIVSAGMVKTVEATMGNFGTDPDDKGKKRIFRDIDNKSLGGVLSGLSVYTGIDVIIFRAAVTVIFIAGLFIDKEWSSAISMVLLLTYIVLWICIPAAKTVAQKCRMYGKPISVNDFGQPSANAVRRSTGSGINSHNGIGRIFVAVLGAVMILWGAGSIIGCTVFDMIPQIVHTYVDDPDAISVIDTIFSTKVTVALAITAILFAIWSIYVGVTLIFDLKSPKWRPGLILFVLFILSAIALGALAARSALQIPLLFGTMTV